VLSSSQRAVDRRCQQKGIQFTWGMLTSEREMAEETASLNSRVSGLAVSGVKHDLSRKLWTVRPPERTKMPSSLYGKYGMASVNARGISYVLLVTIQYHAETHRSFLMALPSDQLRSGLNDPSIDACTMGTLRKSSPNIRRKGMKTPWSRPGPWKPRPSLPRDSSFDVKRARIPAYR
jgi:hypothetical protein